MGQISDRITTSFTYVVCDTPIMNEFCLSSSSSNVIVYFLHFESGDG